MPFATEPIVVEYDPQRFSKAPDKIDKIVRKRLTYLAEYMIEWMKQNGPRDTSLHLESLRYSINSPSDGAYELIIESIAPNAKYALETGRGPGGYPPLDAILGWVKRRGLTTEQTRSVRAVGKRIGSTYQKRRVARSVQRRVAAVTDAAFKVLSGFSEDTKEVRMAAFKVRNKIAKRGTASKPFIFTEVIDATRNNQTGTWLAIEADIAAEV